MRRWSRGRGTRASDFIVYDLRLPRVLVGLLVGLAFGISGAVFQALLKNPLASPDVIGITAGASTPDSVVGETIERILALRGRTAADLTQAAPIDQGSQSYA